MTYRPEIDGLRALSVLAVLGFHAAIPGCSGGFAGVDVFFVISGYLITSIVDREISAGTFSFAKFYERRVRRLFPAFLAVALFTVAASPALYPALQLEVIGQSALSVVFFASNLLFWQRSGYFDGPVEDHPLLHTWSLAVEEQFYLCFPALLLLTLARSRRGAVTLGAMLSVASLAYSVWTLAIDPNRAFYLLPSRAWELGVGALLALSRTKIPYGFPSRLARGCGLALLGSSFVFLHESRPFPGLLAIWPCAGAALILASGTESGLLGSLLASRPIVFVGRISYALYLWHWPLLILGARAVGRPLAPAETAAALALSVAAAHASTQYLEAPFRRKGAGEFPRRTIVVTALAGSAMLAAAGAVLIALAQHRLEAFSASLENQQRHPKEVSQMTELCSLGVSGADLPPRCIVHSSRPPKFVLWGDSHARALAPAVLLAAKQLDAPGRLITHEGCPPLIGVQGVDAWGAQGRCHEEVSAAWEEIQRLDPETILLVARWRIYARGIEGKKTFRLSRNITPERFDPEESEAEYSRLVRETISTLLKQTRVVVIHPPPELPHHPAELMAKLKTNGGLTSGFEAQRALQRPGQLPFLALDGDARLKQVDLTSLFCEQAGCAFSDEGQVLYFDEDHLSLAGARRVVDEVATALE